MKKLVLMVVIGLLVACSNDGKKSDNPYQESHIVDAMPNYQINQEVNPKFKKPLEEMSIEELKDCYGELQRQTGGLTPSQQKAMRMISDRLNQLDSLSSNAEK